MTKIYHTLEDGEVVELRNWIMEPSAGDCVIVRPLDEGDKTKYYILKDLGWTDSQVFFRLNPKILDRIEKRKSVEVPVEILDETQLIWLRASRLSVR